MIDDASFAKWSDLCCLCSLIFLLSLPKYLWSPMQNPCAFVKDLPNFPTLWRLKRPHFGLSQHAVYILLPLRRLSPPIYASWSHLMNNDTLKIDSSDADPECNSLDGVFPIKENCAMFYVCMKGEVGNQERGWNWAIEQLCPVNKQYLLFQVTGRYMCPRGLAFDAAKGICSSRRNGCKEWFNWSRVIPPTTNRRPFTFDTSIFPKRNYRENEDKPYCSIYFRKSTKDKHSIQYATG